MNGLQQEAAPPLKIAPRAERAHGERVLRPYVLTASALEQQIDGKGLAIHFLEVDGRESRVPQVVAAVLVGEGVHGVGAKVGSAGGLGKRGPGPLGGRPG